ncbi:MAG: DUF2809 domain-containing protein [Alphaproteobacteria bacterium]|nr:DUF2809 domain-containing protein [Alphaproteobacteria bacterium]MCB9699638.1 DUF2809 domain-containing protein [Alphaproteobacteria bacterium]
MSSRIRPAAVAAAGWIALVLIFLYAHGWLRGFVGDAVVVVFLDAFLAMIALGPIASARARLITVGTLSMGIECLQTLHLVGPDAHWVLHAVLGSTFDPWDLLAYAIGVAVSAVLERRVYAQRD